MLKKVQMTLLNKNFMNILLLFFLGMVLLFPLYSQQSPVESPYALYKQGRHREAINAALLLIEADKSNISAFVVASISYIGLGQWVNALQIAKEGYKYAPNDLRLIEAISESLYSLKQDKEAFKYLSEYLHKAPNGDAVDWIYYYIAQIYLRLDKFFKADIAMAAAISYRPNNVDWLLKFALIKEKKNEIDEALILYRKVLQLESSNRLARQKIQFNLLSN